MRFRWLRLLLLLGWSASYAALAQPPDTVFIEEMTSPEVAAAIASGKTTILVPIGGTEQNGPHMALGKHNVRARALAEKVARTLGNALVAPVIAYVPEGSVNPPTGHMRYPGTITVPADAFRKILASAGQSFRLAGFRDVVFLGDSGDYQKDDERVASELNREWQSTPARAHAITEYYRAATVEFFESLKRQGYAASDIGPHAGLADTSLMLAVDPRLVRGDRLAPGPGVTGDPRKATAALGNAAVESIVAKTVAAIRAATARH